MNGKTAVTIDGWIQTFALNLSISTRNVIEDWWEQPPSWGPIRDFVNQLGKLLSNYPELEIGVERLFRFINGTRSPSSFIAFLERDLDSLPVLMRILSLRSPSVEWLVEDPDSFDWLRLTAGQSVSAEHMTDVVIAELRGLEDESHLLATMRTFRRRETLRVLCAFCLHGMPWFEVSQQLTGIAQASLAAAIHVASKHSAGRKAVHHELEKRIAVVGLGAFGGCELDFCQPLELLFFRETVSLVPFAVDQEKLQEELDRFVSRVVKWLSNENGFAYQVKQPFASEGDSRVDSRLALEGRRWIQHVENAGRTKHKFALLKARHVFGDSTISLNILEEVPTLLFQRILSGTDVASLGAAYRRIHRRDDGVRSDSDACDGIDEDRIVRWRTELEFFVGYLQLLHGGDSIAVREHNTLRAIDALAKEGCLTESERSILVSALGRFQTAVMQSQQSVCSLKDATASKEKNFGSFDSDGTQLSDAIGKVRQIQQHLQAEVFSGDGNVADESDLILDPNPSPSWVDDLLARHRFQRTHAAYQHLMELAREEIKMLSTRRCRHFLAAIAPQLLKKISQTPAPDLTLENLAKTSRSLGGKGVLWELFSRHEPSMDLYIRLCGASPYLVSLLVNNPGMIDELLDSLMLNRLPDEHQLETMIYELCRGAEDIAPILASFKNAMHLNVGVREVLGKESIVDTHRALSDIADVCVNQVIENEYHNLVKKLGVPQASATGACRFVFASVGKYGAREPNYHSDMGLLCFFESDGETAPMGISRRHIASSNHDFFQQLAQRVSQSLNRVGRFGKLYETKIWNLENERTSFLSWSLPSFLDSIASGILSPQKRLELLDLRVFCGEREFVEVVEKQIDTTLKSLSWLEADTLAIRKQRSTLESTAHQRNLKRGCGGTLDIEWLCRTLAWRNAATGSFTRATGTAMLASHLSRHGVIKESESNFIIESYRYLRGVESGLRLMNTSARHDLPQEKIELERLAYILHVASGKELESECDRLRSMNRKLFEQYVQ